MILNLGNCKIEKATRTPEQWKRGFEKWAVKFSCGRKTFTAFFLQGPGARTIPEPLAERLQERYKNLLKRKVVKVNCYDVTKEDIVDVKKCAAIRPCGFWENFPEGGADQCVDEL